MPTYRISAPDGNTYSIEGPEGASQDDVIRQVLAQHPEAGTPIKPRKGILADVMGGAENLLNIGKTGIAALTGNTNAAAQAGIEREKNLQQKYESGFQPEKITSEFDKGNYLSAAGEALKQVPSAVAGLAPSVGQEFGLAAAGRLGGGALGSVFGPAGTAVGATVGQYAVPLVVNAIQALGSQAQEKAKDQISKGEKVDVDALELAPYASANAALNLVGTRIALPSAFKKAIGQKVAAEADDVARLALMEKATKVAGRGNIETIARGAVGFTAGELPTEILQDVVDRAAIGKPLADDEALQQYRVTALNMVLGFPIGGVTGLQERGGARAQVSLQEQRDRQAQAAADAQAKAKTEAEKVAYRQTPEYAKEAEQAYNDAEKVKADLQAQIQKATKTQPLTEAQKQDNAAINAQLREHAPILKAAASEYRRVRSVLETAKEQERVAAMTPEDYMLEQMQKRTGEGIQVSGRKGAARSLYQTEAAPATKADTTLTDYAAQQIGAARSAGDMDLGSYADYLMQDPKLAQQLVENRVKIPPIQEGNTAFTLSTVDNNNLLSGLKLRLAEKEKQAKKATAQELATRQADLQTQQQVAPVDERMAGFTEGMDALENLRRTGETDFSYLDPMFEKALGGGQPVVKVNEAILPSDKASEDIGKLDKLLAEKEKADQDYVTAKRSNEQAAASAAFGRGNLALDQVNALAKDGPVHVQETIAARRAQQDALTRIEDELDKIRTGNFLGKEKGETASGTIQTAVARAERARADYISAALQEAAIARRAQGRPAMTVDEATKAASELHTALSEWVNRVQALPRREALTEVVTKPAIVRGAKTILGAETEMRDLRPLEERRFGAYHPAVAVIKEQLDTLRNQLANPPRAPQRVETGPLKRQFAAEEARKTAEEKGETATTLAGELRRLQEYVGNLIDKALQRSIPEGETIETEFGPIRTQGIKEALLRVKDLIEDGKANRAMLDAAQNQAERILRGEDLGKQTYTRTVSEPGTNWKAGKVYENVPGKPSETRIGERGRVNKTVSYEAALAPEGSALRELQETLREYEKAQGSLDLDSQTAAKIAKLRAEGKDKEADALERQSIRQAQAQTELFPETREDIGHIRATASNFEKSPAVKAGRAALDVAKKLAIANQKIIDAATERLNKRIPEAQKNYAIAVKEAFAEAKKEAMDARAALYAPDIKNAQDALNTAERQLAAVQTRIGQMIAAAEAIEGRAGEQKALANELEKATALQTEIAAAQQGLAELNAKLNEAYNGAEFSAQAMLDGLVLVERKKLELLDGQLKDLQEFQKSNPAVKQKQAEAKAQRAVVGAAEVAAKRNAEAVNKQKNEMQAAVTARQTGTIQTPAGETLPGSRVTVPPIAQKNFEIKLKDLEKQLKIAQEKREELVAQKKSTKRVDNAIDKIETELSGLTKKTIVEPIEKTTPESRAAKAREKATEDTFERMRREQEKQTAVEEMGRIKTQFDALRAEGQALQEQGKSVARINKQLQTLKAQYNYYKNLAGLVKTAPTAGPVARTQTAAPSKMRTGTAESIEGAGGTSGQQRLSQARKPRKLTPAQEAREVLENNVISAEAALKQATKEALAALEKLNAAKEGKAKEEAQAVVDRAETNERAKANALELAKQALLTPAEKKAQAKLEAATQAELDKGNEFAKLMDEAEALNLTVPHDDVKFAVRDNDIMGVVDGLIKHGSTPAIRERAKGLREFLHGTTIGVDRFVKYQGEMVAGLYEEGRNKITMHPNRVTEEDLLHELTHAATTKAMRTPDSQLTPMQRASKQGIINLFKAAESRLDLKGQYGIKDVHEFMSEVNSSKDFRDRLDGIGKPESLWQKLKRWIAGLFNQPPSKQALDLIEKIYMPSETYFAKPGEQQAFAKAAKYGEDNDLSQLAQRTVAQKQGWWQTMRGGSNYALEFEMQTTDMRAALRKVMEMGAKAFGDSRLFQQAMYSYTKADQKMPLVLSALSNGPLEIYEDDKGLKGIRSTGKDSAKEVFAAVGDIPDRYGNEAAKMQMATMYLIAQRAANKGLAKLDLGALGITQQEVDAAMAAAEANPQLKAALEKVRERYNAYNKGMIEFLADTGAITKAEARDFLRDGDYVPYYRVKENGIAELVFGGERTIRIGDIRHQPHLAALKGGEAKILPINESIPRNTTLLVNKALTNLAARNVGYAMQEIGKATDSMQVRKGYGVASDASIIRFNQEPDPNDPKDNGERHVRVQTNGTVAEGIPAELLIQSLEGAPLTLPGFLKWGGIAGDLLRAGVTRTPLYLLRQLFRDPMAATATSGLDYGMLTAVYKANKEFLKMSTGQSNTAAELIKKGLMQSGIFTGDPDDISKFALQLASGKDFNAFDKLFRMADKAALNADAATRALVYENAIKNGLSEVEAEFAVMESMNFHKRGLSPAIQYASRMIPFFNAQIQGLNVLYKAATGQMPFNEQLKIKQKFYNNAMLLAAGGIAYAMAMQDDDYYKNAKPKDRYSNFFMHVPGLDEPLKLPIPYEFGWFFSLGAAAADAMAGQTDGGQQLAALQSMFKGAIPGASSMGVPQVVKPIAEVWTNKDFNTGFELESTRLRGKSVEERYNANTTELAKAMSKFAPVLSPIQIERIVSGYFGQIPLAVLAATNGLFKDGEVEPVPKNLSEMSFIGSAFQKKYGGADADVMYKLADEAMQAKRDFDAMKREGRAADAKDFVENHRTELRVAPMALQYQKLMGNIRAMEERIRGANMPGDEKRKRIDDLEKRKQDLASKFEQRIKELES